jgi:nucleoside-diphosphate-sugar epimerase
MESLTFNEEWAVRVGDYGATAAFDEIEFVLDESQFKINPQPVELVTSVDVSVNDFVYRAFTDEFLVLFESHFLRNYVHVRDVAKAFVHLIENYDHLNKNAFNVGLTSANMSKLQLAQKVKEYVPNLVIFEEQFKEDFDKRNYVVSNEKLEKTGWFCDFSLDNGIKELLQAYKMIHNFKNREFTNL